MMRIEGILWSEESELHIWSRHRVSPEEVEAAAYSAGLVVKGRGRDVYEVFGKTEAGRYLVIVIRLLEHSLAAVITAREMSAAERRRYKRYVCH